MVSHDLRLCFLKLVNFYFFVPQTFILQSIHTSNVRAIQQLEKIQNGGGRDVFRRQSCINNRYILSF